jgi:hypothetical protein
MTNPTDVDLNQPQPTQPKPTQPTLSFDNVGGTARERRTCPARGSGTGAPGRPLLLETGAARSQERPGGPKLSRWTKLRTDRPPGRSTSSGLKGPR